ncbi:hypothetical protein OG741_16645 [Streptomyces sp. NBC_01410]|uniref:hypothetical protein n=1 Tax=Streptomyces sp. NBC_01410 TaxID=2903856 RepID=UPI0032515B7B
MDDQASASVEACREAVNSAGRRWPPGWVKNQGYIAGAGDAAYRFRGFAARAIDIRTGIEYRTPRAADTHASASAMSDRLDTVRARCIDVSTWASLRRELWNEKRDTER